MWRGFSALFLSVYPSLPTLLPLLKINVSVRHRDMARHSGVREKDSSWGGKSLGEVTDNDEVLYDTKKTYIPLFSALRLLTACFLERYCIFTGKKDAVSLRMLVGFH